MEVTLKDLKKLGPKKAAELWNTMGKNEYERDRIRLKIIVEILEDQTRRELMCGTLLIMLIVMFLPFIIIGFFIYLIVALIVTEISERNKSLGIKS